MKLESVLKKVEKLARKHDRLSPRVVQEKQVKLGLRHPDGTGVVAGITSKGQVTGYLKEVNARGRSRVVPVEGVLRYGGFDAAELGAACEAEGRPGFEEAAFLLLTGELPDPGDLSDFILALGQRRPLPRDLWRILIERAEHEDHMGALHTAISALHLYDPNPNSTTLRDVTRQCIDILAKFPTIVAYMYQVTLAGRSGALHFAEAEPEMSTAEAFLYMLRGGKPAEPADSALFDLCLLLHAEHGGGNNSTFTVRTVTSSGANSYMAICSGIASLSGHLHGGANEAVMGMMDDIKEHVRDWGDREEVARYLIRILDGKAGDGSRKIYGVGHAVYTRSDPRAVVLSERAWEMAQARGRTGEYHLYRTVAEEGARLVRERKKKIVSANVDFYSGFVYDMLGIPRDLFTPIFAMARVAGWSAHRLEEIVQGRIIRPSYLSSLPAESRVYVPLSKRGCARKK